VTRATGSDLTNVMRTPVSGGRSQVSEVPRKGAGQRWATMFFPSTWRGLRPNSNNNEAIDGVALFRAGLTLETYVTGAPNPVKCSASYGRGNSMASETPLSDVRFLTVAEVALIMRVSKMTVYRLVHSGELEAIRVGRSFRVPEAAVNQYLKAAFVGTG
jgi:excisionase family DNA binding protein